MATVKMSLKKMSKMMRKLDLCMMTTITTNGMTASRPMSNNGDVEYDGNSYFFTWEKSHLVKDLKKNPHVNLSFNGKKKVYISVSGKAKLVTDRDVMEEHWTKDLEIWFKDGLDTKGLVMIQVIASRLKYWEGEDEGEVVLKK
jgi:general stress protein 26